MIDLKTLDLQQLNLILHNMRIYGVSKDRQDRVINEINSRENNNASNK